MILIYFIKFVFVLKPNNGVNNLNLKNFIILLGFNLLIIYLIKIVESFILLPEFYHAINDSIEDIFEMAGFFLFWVGIITPFVEEFIFRYFLVGNDYKKVLPAIFIIILYSIFTFNGLDFYDLLNLICLIYFSIIIFLFILDLKIRYRIFIFSSIILFSVYHLSNFQFEELKVYYIYIPVIILPQLILGYILVFLRINFGFIYSFLYHGLYNIFLVMIIYFIYWFTDTIY